MTAHPLRAMEQSILQRDCAMTARPPHVIIGRALKRGWCGKVRGRSFRIRSSHLSEKGVRLAQKMQVGPMHSCGHTAIKAEAGPTSGQTWRLSHFAVRELQEQRVHLALCPGRSPPFVAVKRPPRPNKSAMQNRFTATRRALDLL
jgi:hypothetical protein